MDKRSHNRDVSGDKFVTLCGAIVDSSVTGGWSGCRRSGKNGKDKKV